MGHRYAPRSTIAEPRPHLLRAVLDFVRAAAACPGVVRIALIGSLTTRKRVPKDADVLVTIADSTMDLAALARLGRRLKGTTQHINLGADIFLADASGKYIGRICRFRECHPRAACRAQHCRLRPHLNDDLHVVRLATDLIREPPLDLWPHIVRRTDLPPDVEQVLLAPWEGEIASAGQGGHSGGESARAGEPPAIRDGDDA